MIRLSINKRIRLIKRLYRTNYRITTGIERLTPGTSKTIWVGPGGTASIKLPELGASVKGIIIADPCIDGTFGYPCTFGPAYDILNNLSAFLNLISKEIDYYGMLGDNFYDLNGTLTEKFFNKLDARTKSVPFLTVRLGLFIYRSNKLTRKADSRKPRFLEFWSQARAHNDDRIFIV